MTLRTIHSVDCHFSHTHYKLSISNKNYYLLFKLCKSHHSVPEISENFNNSDPNNKDDRWKHFSKCNGSLTLNLISCCIQLSLSVIKDESNMLTLAVYEGFNNQHTTSMHV